MMVASERRKICLREWRIWPILTACAGTQLAYAILHIVVEDFFACILTLFSFIGSLCCIVSRRSEVVLANLLLQLVIFTTLFICCCLGTSSMQIWHEKKKLAPLVATQILFFAAVLILNAILLVLKKRQRHDAAPEESAFANRKLPSGRTGSSATVYTRSPSSPHTLFRLQQQGEEQQAQSHQGQGRETCSCFIPVCTVADASRSITRRKPSSLYNRELSGVNQDSPDPLCEDENDGEGRTTLTMYRAARPSAGEKSADTSHLVIRSQQIKAAASVQHQGAPDRSTTLQTMSGMCGSNSCTSTAPLIHQQSCALHGRALYSVSTGETRTFDGGERRTQADEAPALPRSVVAEDTATARGAAGCPCLCLEDYEHKQNLANAVRPLSPAIPRRCLNCHFHNRYISCSCPQQTSGAFPVSSIPALHSCISLHDGGTRCGAASLEQNELSYRPPSSRKRKGFFVAHVKKSVHRCWERVLTYLGQPIDCDTVLKAANIKPQALQQSFPVTHVTPGRSITGETSPKVEGRIRREPPQELLSISHSLYQCRRTSVADSKMSSEDVCGARVACAELNDVEKDADRDGKGDELEDHEDPTQQKYVTAPQRVRQSKNTDTSGALLPAVPLECALQSMQRQSTRNSCENPASCSGEVSSSAARGGPNRNAERHDVGVLSVAEVHTEAEQQVVLEQTANRESGSKCHTNSATPTNPSPAAGLDSKDVASREDIISKQALVPIDFSPAAARGDHQRRNEQTLLDATEVWEGVTRTAGKQKRRSGMEVGIGEERVDQVLQLSTSDDALLNNELTLQSSDAEVSAKLEEAVSAVEVTEVGKSSPQLQKIDNHPSRCEADDKHGILPTSIINETHDTLEKVGMSSRTLHAVLPPETFNMLPAGVNAVDEERTICLLPPLHGRAGDAQLSKVGKTVEECGQIRKADKNVKDQIPSTIETAALSATPEQLPPIHLRGEPNSQELLLSDQGESQLLASQPCPRECRPAERGLTAPGQDAVDSGNYVFSRRSDEDSLEAARERRVIVSKLSSELQEHTEVGNSVDVSCGQADTFQNGTVNTHATADAMRVTSNVVHAPGASNWESSDEVECYAEHSAVKSSTAAANNVDGMQVYSRPRKASTTEEITLVGGTVSREKVVYKDHLTRALTSNITPRAEEEDSWEDESEEAEGQTQAVRLTQKGGEGGSEWELSDVSDEGTRVENRRQGHGTHRTQRSRHLPGEIPAIYGKKTGRKKNRESRRNG